MGYTTCGLHGRRTCWRCDRCPTCEPETGRLLRGDYCRQCTDKLIAEGYVWSNYTKNYEKRDFAEHGKARELKAELFEAPFNLAGEQIDNSTTAEGEARVRALAESEARKAQQAFPSLLESSEKERSNKLHCRKCGRHLDPVPGYEKARWRHCPCGHVAVTPYLNL